MIEQIPLKELCGIDMVPQATIGKPFTHFRESLGIYFSEDFDDLDYYKGAALRLLDEQVFGVPFTLIYYLDHPENTTSVYLPSEIQSPKVISMILSSIVANLQVSPKEVLWARSWAFDMR